MKKRILSLATVAALMALMLVAMASAALAVPPAGFELGCEGGTTNANHAVNASNPSSDAQDNHDFPDQADDAQEEHGDAGSNRALETRPLDSGDNCQNEPPDHPHD
jgi:hypothetical protein